MKMEKFGWYAPAAKAIPAMPAVATELEFLIKADDSSTLEPNQEIAESYRQADGMQKLFGIEPQEERVHPTMPYEDLIVKVFGASNPTVMDIRSKEPLAAPPSLEKRGKNKDIFNGSQVEFHGANKWTHFFFNGELVRMRCEGPDFPEPLEFDAQGNPATLTTKAADAANLAKSQREIPTPVDPQFAHLVRIGDDRE